MVDGRKAAGDRVPPGSALHGREPLRRQLRRYLVHADFGIDQDMRRVVQDRAPPRIQRQRALDEAFAQRRRHIGLGIPLGAGMIAGYTKPGPVEPAEPTLDWNLPVRVPPEKPADDAEPDRLARAR